MHIYYRIQIVILQILFIRPFKVTLTNTEKILQTNCGQTILLREKTLSGAKERGDKMFDSKADFTNYATFRFSGMVKEAVSPRRLFQRIMGKIALE